MTHAAWLSIPIAFALASAGEAQEIHKCVGDGGIIYQNAPCTGGQIDAGVLRLPGYADPPERDGATSPSIEDAPSAQPVEAPQPFAPEPAAPDGRDAFPFRTSIALGISDDQVLNLPQWGRPTRIERSGRHGGWREVWTYARGPDVRQLAFVGGRLAGIEGAPGTLRIASAEAPGTRTARQM